MNSPSSRRRSIVSLALPFAVLAAACGAAPDDEVDLEEETSANSAAASSDYIAPRSKPFVSGSNGYPYYRTPSITKAADGTLLAFAEGRDRREDDCTSDIVLRRSTDNGATWKAQQVVAGQSSTARFAYPVPVVLGNGKIVLLYNRSRFVTKEEDRGCRKVFMSR